MKFRNDFLNFMRIDVLKNMAAVHHVELADVTKVCNAGNNIRFAPWIRIQADFLTGWKPLWEWFPSTSCVKHADQAAPFHRPSADSVFMIS